MRTHTTLVRSLALTLTTLAAGACSDGTTPVAPVVPSAPSLAKGGPKPLPTNGRIYFASDFAGTGNDVYSVNPDGSDRRRLTYSPEHELGLDVSRDGNKLVTAGTAASFSEGRLYTMNMDGTNRRLVLSRSDGAVTGPAWSPDGRAIAYAAAGNSNSNESAIWTVAANGGKVTQLTGAGQSAHSPTWSPDGARIAYTAITPGQPGTDIYVMNADGSAGQLLYDCAVACMNPVWSRDGTQIFFIAADANGLQVQSCALQQAGAICGIPVAAGVSTYMFALSPDESQLAFRQDEISAQRVATANVNGSAQAAVTADLGTIYDVAWGR